MGQLITGEKIVWPAETVDLRNTRLESSLGQFRPDIITGDEQGELLIGIRVTHAVNSTKAVAVRQGGYRMIEIDLSNMARDTLLDSESFKSQVLFSEWDSGHSHGTSCKETHSGEYASTSDVPPRRAAAIVASRKS